MTGTAVPVLDPIIPATRAPFAGLTIEGGSTREDAESRAESRWVKWVAHGREQDRRLYRRAVTVLILVLGAFLAWSVVVVAIP